MGHIQQIIFVCTGNTCRSPMAESLYISMEFGKDIKASSRGLVVLFPEPLNPKAETVLKTHGLELNNHTAKQLKDNEINETTLVLTMTQNQKTTLLKEYCVNREHCFTLKEFVGETGDVVDPYGGSLMDYEECFSELARLVRKMAYRIEKENIAADNKEGS